MVKECVRFPSKVTSDNAPTKGDSDRVDGLRVIQCEFNCARNLVAAREAGELLMVLNDTDWWIAEDAESSPGLVLQPTADIVRVFGAREPLCCDAVGWNAENARISRGDG